jgi:transcriptional regulator with XRE-family HTH domain
MEGSENRIAPCREKARLKQAELADLLGISRGQLSNMESGNRNVDLAQMREIARHCGCAVVDLLMPDDAPGLPSKLESAMLAELRSQPGYDPRGILAAVRGILQACQGVISTASAPRSLDGDPALVQGLSERWNQLDNSGRQKTLGLLDAARDFSR